MVTEDKRGAVTLHDIYDGVTHRVQLQHVAYTNVITEVTGRVYTQLVFDRETWLNVKETEHDIYGPSDPDMPKKSKVK